MVRKKKVFVVFPHIIIQMYINIIVILQHKMFNSNKDIEKRTEDMRYV